jgi:hypothetical protein
MNKVKVSYNLEITHRTFGKECLVVIENIDPLEGVTELPQVKSINYTDLSLVTVVMDEDGNVINEFTCRID